MPIHTETLTRWVDQYTDDLYAWALHKVSDPETAKDLVQDTFLAAAEKIDAFKGDSTPKTWLFSILNHKIIDTYRKKVKQPVKTDSQLFAGLFDENGSWRKEKLPQHWQEEDEHLLDDEAFMKILKQCLDMLPDTWNICVKLKYLTGKNGAEICQEVGLSTTNYWQIIHRAKLQLRECIESNWYDQ